MPESFLSRAALLARMVGAEDGAQRLRFGKSFGHGFFVKVSAKNIHAVRACQIIENLSIQIGDLNTICRLQEGAYFEVFAHQWAELKRHPVSRDELHVRDVAPGFCGGLHAEFLASLQGLCEGEKGVSAQVPNVFWCAIAVKKLLLAVAVSRQPPGQSLGHARVACKRAVFGSRQLYAPVNCRCQSGQSAQTDPCGVHS